MIIYRNHNKKTNIRSLGTTDNTYNLVYLVKFIKLVLLKLYVTKISKDLLIWFVVFDL